MARDWLDEANDIRNNAHVVNGGNSTTTVDCPKCRGSGQTRWGPCFSCKGKGQRTQRSIAASKGAKTAASNKAVAYAAWCKTDIGEWCLRNQEWNEFAAKMIDGAQAYGKLTENQEAAIRRSMAKQAERREASKEAAAKGAPVVSTDAIDALFATALEHGLKAPKFYAGAITIYPAKASGRNPGAIYVKHNGEYAGKIAGGIFTKAYGCRPEVIALVAELAEDPKGTAIRYGRSTGRCCMCGRELTDAESVAAGIGPVCSTNWGL